MRKCFTRAFALVMAVLTLVSQMVFVSVADDTAVNIACTCDPAAERTGTLHDHVEPTCGFYGYDLFICDACAGYYTVLTDAPTGEHITNIEKATCLEDMYCTVCNKTLATATGHNWEVTVVAPTCEEDGYTAHECLNCGEYNETDPVPAPGHEWVKDEDRSVAAGCTDDGLLVEVCSVCQKERETVVPATGMHINYVVDRVAPTCYEDGFAILVCNVCGYSFIAPDVDSKLGHDFVVHDAKPSTCTEDGWYEYETCTRCDYNSFEVDPADGHVRGEVVVENGTPATCTEPGSYDEVVYCDVCGVELSRVRKVEGPTGHDEAEAVIENVKEETCEEDGSYDEVVYCVKCDAELSRKTVVVDEIEDHNWEITTYEKTCSARGYDHYKCLRCGFEYDTNYVEIDPFSHKGIVEGREEATCTSVGNTGSLVCEYCGVVLNPGDVIPMKDHVLTEFEGKEPTCDEEGWEAYVECANCDTFGKEVIPALGHLSEKSIGVVAPSCTEKGYTTWYCTRITEDGSECGHIWSGNYEDALGHTPEVDAAVEPTCTETGLTEGSHCAVCQEILVAQEVVDALGHVEVEDEAVAPTCTETGLTAGSHCDRCGEVFVAQEEVPAAGHVEGRPEIKHVIDATCTEGGSYEEVIYCAVCAEILSTTVIDTPPYGHTVTETVVENEVLPTCTEYGYYEDVVYCVACREELSRTPVDVDPLGHTPYEVVTPATEEAVGYVDTYCSVCDAHLGTTYLDEYVTFTYEAYGINGETTAINSGYVTVEVYANVESDYARLFGVDIDLGFNENLQFVEANGALFNNFVVNSYEDGVVKFTTDMGLAQGDKVLANGKYLVATLVFKVAGNFYAADAVFTVEADECAFARGEYLNELYVDFGEGTYIHVARLGDITGDGLLNVVDSKAFCTWFDDESNAGAYNFVIDMDKDGEITLNDLVILREAIVHIDDYLA